MPEAPTPRPSRPCPVCNEPLTPKDLRGVELDICEQHGVWLDEGELEEIAHRIKRAEGVLRRAQVRRARQEGKVSAYIWGSLAFLFDKLPPRAAGERSKSRRPAKR